MDSITSEIAKHIPKGPYYVPALCLLAIVSLLMSGFFLRLGGLIVEKLIELTKLNPGAKKVLARTIALVGFVLLLVWLTRYFLHVFALVLGVIILAIGLRIFLMLWGFLNIREGVAQALIIGFSILVAIAIFSYVLSKLPVQSTTINYTAFDTAAGSLTVPDNTIRGTVGGIEVEKR